MRHETPESVARVLARHAPRSLNHVLDPATGTGALLLPLASRLESRAKRVVCCDIDEAALDQVRTAFGHRLRSRLQLVSDDFLSWSGSQLATGNAARFDCIVMNPPFAGRKKQMVEVHVGDDAPWLNREVRHVPLEIGFIFQAVRMLRPAGRLLAVVPTSIVLGENTEWFRRSLMEMGAVRYVHELPRHSFPNVESRVYLLVFDKGRSQGPVVLRNHDLKAPTSMSCRIDGHGPLLRFDHSFQLAWSKYRSLLQLKTHGWQILSKEVTIMRGREESPSGKESAVHTCDFRRGLWRANGRLDSDDLYQAIFTAGKAVIKAIPLHHYAAPEDLTFTVEMATDDIEEESSEVGDSLPTLYMYENCVGGVGLARRTYEILEELLCEALHVVIEGCPRCSSDPKSTGCPACVADVSEQHNRALGRRLLKNWIDGIGRSKKARTASRKSGKHKLLSKYGFEDVELIDSGGFGDVYRASRQGATCAVKIARLGKTGMKSLAREGLLLKRLREEPGLSCEHLLRVHDLIEDGEEVLIVMEYANEGTLAQRIGSSGYHPVGGQGAQRLPALIGDFLPVVDGVRHLHRNGIVHRDLKPQNILFVHEAPKLADLGIARRCKETTRGAGTPGYEAPGQFERRHEPSEADDVYSLALILHEMVAGQERLPDWSGDERKLHRSIPKELRPILNRALASDTAQRFHDADQFGLALRSLLSEAR